MLTLIKSAVTIAFVLFSPGFSFATQQENEHRDGTEVGKLVEHPQPGVTLIGQRNFWQELGISSRTAISPDGRFLAAIQDSRTLIVLDRSTSEIIQRFPLQVETVYAMAFSPLGNRLAVVGFTNVRADSPELNESSLSGITTENICYVFDRNFEIQCEIEIPPAEIEEPSDTLDAIYALNFSPDEEFLIASGQLASHWISLNTTKVIQSKTINGDLNVVFLSDDLVYLPRRKLIWNRIDNSVEPTKYLGEFPVTKLQNTCIFHPNLPLVVYADRTEKTLSVSNWSTGKKIFELKITKGTLRHATFSIDGKTLVTIHQSDSADDESETTLHAFDLTRRQLITQATIEGKHYFGMKFSSPEDLVLQLYEPPGFATVALDKNLGTVLRKLCQQNAKTSDIAVNHDATWAVTQNGTNWIDLKEGTIHKLSDYYSAPLSLNGERGYMLSTRNGNSETQLNLLEVTTTKKIAAFDLPDPPAIVDRVVEMLSGKESRFYNHSEPMALRATDKYACAMIVLSNGLDFSFEYMAWSLKTKKTVENFQIRDNIRYDINRFRFPAAISPSAEKIAYATPTHLKIVDTGSERAVTEIAIAGVDSIQFSHDGRFIAVGIDAKTGNQFNKVQIFGMESGELVREFSEGNLQFSFAEDASRFAIASVQKGSAVQIFDTQNWKQELEFATEFGQRSCIGISGDGKTLVFGLTSSQIEVWELKALAGPE